MYALPPVLLGGQLSDLADLAAGRQQIRPDPLQLGLGVAMLLVLVMLAATSHRWLEAEQGGAEGGDEEGGGEGGREGGGGEGGSYEGGGGDNGRNYPLV